MATRLSSEFRLAASCTMWPPSDRRSAAIREAAASPVDWPRLLRVARRHQIIGLVHDGLTRVKLSLPSEIAEQIAVESTIVTGENLAIAQESLRLQRLFDEADLPILFVKGAALALLAFGNLGLRASQDIDLLVSYEALSAATAVILRAGYRRVDPPPNITGEQLQLLMRLRKDIGFVHEATGLRIELHWRLFLNPHAMDESSITRAARVVRISGFKGLRTLGKEDLFAYLCMHGALHWWNRLKWLADVNALLASTPGDEVEHLLRAAEARGIGRAAPQALLLCRNLLQAPLPAALMVTLDKGTAVRWLLTTALNAMTRGQGEQDPHQARFGTTGGSLSTFLLSPRWRYKMAELGMLLTNPTDVVAVPLPRRLRFLYPLLRLPLWVWRHTVNPNARQHS